MKRFFTLIFVALSALVLAGCAQEQPDGAEYLVDNSLGILSRDVFFQPGGGTGSIVVDTEGTVTASSNKDWLTVSVNGSTVELTAAKNPDIESRYAEVTIKSGESGATVIAQQYGYKTVSFSGNDIVASGKSQTHSFLYTYEEDMVVSSDADWIKASVATENDQQSVKIELAENGTGAVRTGKVSWELGMESGEINVKQFPNFAVNEAWTMEYVRDEETNSIFDVEGVEGSYLVGMLTQAQFKSKYDGSFETYAFDVAAAADPTALFDHVGEIPWAFLATGIYEAILVGVDANNDPTGEYNYYEIEIAREDVRTPYEKWLGKWEVTRQSVTDTWEITENVFGESFYIAGIDGNSTALAGVKAVAKFNSADNTITIRSQTNLGTYTSNSGENCIINLYALYNESSSIIGGEHDCATLTADEKFETGTITSAGTVTPSGGSATPVTGIVYFAHPEGSNNGYVFDNQIFYKWPETMTKIEDGSSSGGGEGGGEGGGSYADWLGTWNLSAGSLSVSENEAGKSYTVVYSGWEDVEFSTNFDASTGDMVFTYQLLFEYDIDEYYLTGVETVGESRYVRFGDPNKGNEIARAKMSGSMATITGATYTSDDEGSVNVQGLGFRDYQVEDTADYDKGWYRLTGYDDIALPASASKSGAGVMQKAQSWNGGFSVSKSWIGRGLAPRSTSPYRPGVHPMKMFVAE
ncbi:MAG: BACON domain-containing protein [Bacteroidales bacterium]|nr:BACON domain-containing protein [Bacteroidales bacterium]